MEKTRFVNGDRELFANYGITSFIAKGNNTVYETVHRSNKDDVQCVKEIRLVDRNAETVFEKEVKLLDFLRKHPHPAVIEFKGSYVVAQELSEFNCSRKGFIQMEKGITSLDHLINERVQTGKHFTEEEVMQFIGSMIDAHRHLQALSIAHRDIKPQNIILVGLDPLRYKVCDVGVGTAVGTDSTRTRTLMGTVNYLSPELLRAYRENKFTITYNPYKSDVYSLGLVLLYFCSLKKPLAKERGEQEEKYLLALIKEVKREYSGINGLSKTLKLMLKYNDAQRPDFEELHQKIQENGWLKLKYDGFRATGLHAFMATSVPVEGETTIQSMQDMPMLQLLLKNPQVVQALRIQLSNLGRNQQELKDLMDQLRKIKNLDLTRLWINFELNSMEGQAIKSLCEGIEKNVGLEELQLQLWNNRLEQRGFTFVLDMFRKLPSLRRLYLQVSANNLADFPAFEEKIGQLGELTELEQLTLDLGLNRFSSDTVPHLFTTLSKLVKLKKLKLNLESNRITFMGLKSLPQTLGCLKQLRELSINLSGNRVGNEGMYALGDLMAMLPNLCGYELVLWNSQLADKGLVEFMKSASGVCKQIKQLRLVLWNNQLTEKSAEALGNRLPELNSLEKIYVNFSNNKIGDGGVRLLNKAMIELPLLREVKLGLDSTNLTEVGCRYIGRMLSVHRNLTKLDLSLRANKIGLTGLEFIGAGLKDAKKLSQLWLVLEGCKVTDDGILLLSKVLPRLKQLQTVYMNLADCNIFDDGMFTLLKVLMTHVESAKQISLDYRRNMVSPAMRSRMLYEVGSDKRVDLKLDESEA